MTGGIACVIEAELALGPATDPAAVGAAVTVELCGHWEHDGACRWPHNSSVDARTEPACLRTLYVAEEADAPVVAHRIETALRAGAGWSVLSVSKRPVARSERALARRLLSGT